MPELAILSQAKYPPAGTTTIGLLRANTGQKVAFTPPTQEQISNTVSLVMSLKRYEDSPSTVTLKNVNDLLTKMNFKTSRITEDPNSLYFFPAKIKDYGICFIWRFGDLKIPGKPETYDNPVYPNCVVSPHEGTDGALKPALAEYMLGGKFLLLNAAHAHSSKAPSPLQHSRNISDPAHSSATLFVPFLKTTLQNLYPYMVESVIHGLSDTNSKTGKKKQLKLWFINSYGNQFLLDQKSWPALAAVAMAQQKNRFVADRSIAVGSQLPGRITDVNGVSRPLTNPNNMNNPIFSFIEHPPQTDVTAHIANQARSVGSRGKRIDHALHREHGQQFTEYSAALEAEMAAIKQAMDWNLRWDDRVHTLDPDKLPETVLQDMRLFPQWFEDQLKLLPTLISSGKVPAMVAARAVVEVNEEDDPEDLIDDNSEISEEVEGIEHDDAKEVEATVEETQDMSEKAQPKTSPRKRARIT